MNSNDAQRMFKKKTYLALFQNLIFMFFVLNKALDFLLNCGNLGFVVVCLAFEVAVF